MHTYALAAVEISVEPQDPELAGDDGATELVREIEDTAKVALAVDVVELAAGAGLHHPS